MSTKTKIGKEWVKCQLILAETGETLHLTFAPGQTRKKIIAHIDGRTDVGWVELSAIAGAAAPHDATLSLSLKGEGVHQAKAPAATVPASPKLKAPTPAPAPVVEAPKAAAVEAPKPVVAAEPAPVVEASDASSEETTTSEVKESAADTTPAAGGRRGRPRQGTEG